MNTMKFTDLTVGQMEAIVNKFGGVDQAVLFSREKDLIVVPESDFVSKSKLITLLSRQVKSWRVVKNDQSLKTIDDFCKVFEKTNKIINKLAMDLYLRHVGVEESIDTENFELIALTAQDLDIDKFSYGPESVLPRAFQFGFKSIPPRAALLLCMEDCWNARPIVMIGSKGFYNPYCCPSILCVGKGGISIHESCQRNDVNTEYVFLLPKVR